MIEDSKDICTATPPPERPTNSKEFTISKKLHIPGLQIK